MQRKHYLILVAAVTLLVGVGAAGVGYKLWRRSQNRLKPPPASLLTAPKLEIGELPSLPPVNVLADVPDVTVSEVARELRIVWSLRWAPDGRLFITRATRPAAGAEARRGNARGLRAPEHGTRR